MTPPFTLPAYLFPQGLRLQIDPDLLRGSNGNPVSPTPLSESPPIETASSATEFVQKLQCPVVQYFTSDIHISQPTQMGHLMGAVSVTKTFSGAGMPEAQLLGNGAVLRTLVRKANRITDQQVDEACKQTPRNISDLGDSIDTGDIRREWPRYVAITDRIEKEDPRNKTVARNSGNHNMSMIGVISTDKGLDAFIKLLYLDTLGLRDLGKDVWGLMVGGEENRSTKERAVNAIIDDLYKEKPSPPIITHAGPIGVHLEDGRDWHWKDRKQTFENFFVRKGNDRFYAVVRQQPKVLASPSYENMFLISVRRMGVHQTPDGPRAVWAIGVDTTDRSGARNSFGLINEHFTREQNEALEAAKEVIQDEDPNHNPIFISDSHYNYFRNPDYLAHLYGHIHARALVEETDRKTGKKQFRYAVPSVSDNAEILVMKQYVEGNELVFDNTYVGLDEDDFSGNSPAVEAEINAYGDHLITHPETVNNVNGDTLRELGDPEQTDMTTMVNEDFVDPDYGLLTDPNRINYKVLGDDALFTDALKALRFMQLFSSVIKLNLKEAGYDQDARVFDAYFKDYHFLLHSFLNEMVKELLTGEHAATHFNESAFASLMGRVQDRFNDMTRHIERLIEVETASDKPDGKQKEIMRSMDKLVPNLRQYMAYYRTWMMGPDFVIHAGQDARARTWHATAFKSDYFLECLKQAENGLANDSWAQAFVLRAHIRVREQGNEYYFRKASSKVPDSFQIRLNLKTGERKLVVTKPSSIDPETQPPKPKKKRPESYKVRYQGGLPPSKLNHSGDYHFTGTIGYGLTNIPNVQHGLHLDFGMLVHILDKAGLPRIYFETSLGMNTSGPQGLEFTYTNALTIGYAKYFGIGPMGWVSLALGRDYLSNPHPYFGAFVGGRLDIYKKHITIEAGNEWVRDIPAASWSDNNPRVMFKTDVFQWFRSLGVLDRSF